MNGWPRRVVTRHRYLTRSGVKSFPYVHGGQNRVPVESQSQETFPVLLITFRLACGHTVRRVVVSRPRYRPKRLFCEVCGNSRGTGSPKEAAAAAKRMAKRRPFSLVYPVGTIGGR